MFLLFFSVCVSSHVIPHYLVAVTHNLKGVVLPLPLGSIADGRVLTCTVLAFLFVFFFKLRSIRDRYYGVALLCSVWVLLSKVGGAGSGVCGSLLMLLFLVWAVLRGGCWACWVHKGWRGEGEGADSQLACAVC